MDSGAGQGTRSEGSGMNRPGYRGGESTSDKCRLAVAEVVSPKAEVGVSGWWRVMKPSFYKAVGPRALARHPFLQQPFCRQPQIGRLAVQR